MREGSAAPFERVAVIGLGLIGGSLARDLASAGVRVLGHDLDGDTVERARADGVLHATLDPELEGIEASEAVVLALPVRATADALGSLAGRLASVRLVTDTGSTKRGAQAAAVAAGLGGQFVGSHPLAGSERTGWPASRTGRFRDRPVYLCPTGETQPEAARLARRLWEAVGGRPREIGAEAHDALLARTSHLPQALATCLALALREAGVDPGDLGPGGRDMTRLAASSPEMWSDVLAENGDAVGAALAGLEARLGEMREAVARGDREALRRMVAEGGRW